MMKIQDAVYKRRVDNIKSLIFMSTTSCLQLHVYNFMSTTSCLQLHVYNFMSTTSCLQLHRLQHEASSLQLQTKSTTSSSTTWSLQLHVYNIRSWSLVCVCMCVCVYVTTSCLRPGASYLKLHVHNIQSPYLQVDIFNYMSTTRSFKSTTSD